MSGAICSVCGREIKRVEPCAYNRRGLYTCPECCEKCYQSEPFPCREHDLRTARKAGKNKEE